VTGAKRFLFGTALLGISTAVHADATALLLPATAQTEVKLVDPELTTAISTAPVTLVEPPPEVSLPPVIAEPGQWRGVQCGVLEPRFAIFHHDDKWKSFWDRGLAPYSSRLKKIPPVDFSKDMVVGVFLGQKDFPYYEVQIRSVTTENRPGVGPAVVVRFREIDKMMGVFTPPFPIQPFHLKKVPSFNGPVIFEKVKR